jgi:hypothetical protein
VNCVSVETSFSGSKSGLLVDPRDGRIELFKGGVERPGKSVTVGVQRGRMGSEDPKIKLAVEEGDALPVGRQTVPVRLGLPVNQGAEPQTPEVVGHLRGAIGTAEQCSDAGPKVAMINDN